MDKLWAPWRLAYITDDKKDKKGCVFCNILKEKKDKKNYIFLRSKNSFAVLNIFPYNNGHVLIIPNRHVSDLSKLKKDEREDLFDLLGEAKSLIDQTLKPGGYNVGINLGKVAGAGFPGHLHIHLVPRFRGDVNFMPVTADTKVISQSLKTLYDRLSDAKKRKY
ncbi:MAG: HIT domain-containing protein [Candidatus Zapsychrus exili]|nr:HIT domain-containing protein [Candidatus Zapsychrus exili]